MHMRITYMHTTSAHYEMLPEQHLKGPKWWGCGAITSHCNYGYGDVMRMLRRTQIND
jgi:hypothetical protein